MVKADRPSRVTAYTDTMGTTEGAHYRRFASSTSPDVHLFSIMDDKATKRIRSKAETKSQEPQYHLTNLCAMFQHCRYCSLHQPRLCEPTCKMIANPPQPQASDEGVVAMILDTNILQGMY